MLTHNESCAVCWRVQSDRDRALFGVCLTQACCRSLLDADRRCLHFRRSSSSFRKHQESCNQTSSPHHPSDWRFAIAPQLATPRWQNAPIPQAAARTCWRHLQRLGRRYPRRSRQRSHGIEASTHGFAALTQMSNAGIPLRVNSNS